MLKALTASLAALAILLPAAAFAQSPKCGPYKQIVKPLAEKYKEEPRAIGVLDETHVMMLFLSPAAETWTIIVVDADRNACMFADGEDWTESKLKVPGEDM